MPAHTIWKGMYSNMGFLSDLFNPPPIKTQPDFPTIDTALTPHAITSIESGIFQPFPVKKLTARTGEDCLFCDHAVMITEKLRVVARQRKGYGCSVRIMKGLYFHDGNGGSVSIRDNVPEYNQGKLYITNQRIIFSADSRAFQKPLKDLITYSVDGSCLVLQFTNKSYRIYLPVVSCAEKVIEHVL